MDYFDTLFPIAMVAIGVFLTLFYGVYIKRRDLGSGMDTQAKRIAVYEAIGIGLAFISWGAIVFFVLKP